jgi:cyclopropane fatty-acyl-phospholipid synthase-like methyltransferase
MNYIQSEEPKDHWYMLDVKDKIVLDLGCGLWDSKTPTPYYFIEQGASKVIGVDSSIESYNWYKQNFNHSKFMLHLDNIDDIEKFKMFLSYYKPHVVKIDIEGMELLMGNLTKDYFTSVREMAIEYHGLAHNIMLKTMFNEWGFTEVEQYAFEGIPVDAQGVYHAKKPRQIITKIRETANNGNK